MRRFKKILKITGFVLLALIATAGLFYAYASYRVNQRADKQYQFPKEDLAFTPDSALVQKGKHLIEIKGCADCHGSNLGGKAFINEAPLGTIYAANLTGGEGGIGSRYTTTNWMAALRHGVDSEGKALLIMPSHETATLSKEDLKAIIAYCQSVPAVNQSFPENNVGPVLRLMAHLDKVVLFPVEKINHSQPAPDSIAQVAGVQLGAYLAVSCQGCHRPNLKGGEPPVPGMLPPPDITSTGNPGKWSLDQFRHTLRTGKTADGRQLDNKNMPWQMTAKYTDLEIESVYLYLKSLK